MGPFNKTISMVFLLSCTVSYDAFASDATQSDAFAEFDPIYLNNSRLDKTIDLTAFSHGNPLQPGEYYVEVYVNEVWQGKELVLFVESESSSARIGLCASQSLISRLSLIHSLLGETPLATTLALDCESIEQLLGEKVSYSFSSLDNRLRFTIPQAYLDMKPAGYVDPSLWEAGNNTFFTAYQMNHYQSSNRLGGNYSYNYLGLNSGINLGAWHLRHQGSYSWSSNLSGAYIPFKTALQTDVISLKSQLSFGDIFSAGNLFNGVALRGVQLQTDDRMLPASKRGYAPVVRGVANSNAMISIRQNGREFYNKTVPPGPFAIDDLYMMSNSGELTVTVTEADGSVSEFTVPYAAVGQIIRPGNTKFEINSGYLRQSNRILAEYGTLATWQHGVNNLLTLNSGIIVAKSYYSAIIGNVFSTPLGTFGSDVTLANSLFDDADNSYGQSYHFYFSNSIQSTKTNFNIAAYRYSTKGYYSWDQVATENETKWRESRTGYRSNRPKGQFALTVNQMLPAAWGSFYLNATHKNYWASDDKENSMSVGYSNNYRDLSYQLTMTNTRYNYEKSWDRQYSLNFSLPLGSSKRLPRLNALYQRDSRGQQSYNAGISGSLGEDNQYSYGLNSAYGSQNHATNWAMNGSGRLQYSTLSASYAHNEMSSQWSASASGGAVLHSGRITLANELTDSFAIIHVPNAQGAKIGSGNGIKLDSQGYAIYPYLSAYQQNTLSIDPKGLPAGLEIKVTSKDVYPRANSSVLVTLPTRMGSAVLVQIALTNGEPVPIGASVSLESEPLGTITPGGRLFALGLAESGTLKVKWGEKHQHCSIPFVLQGQTTPLNNGIQLLKLTCVDDSTQQGVKP